MKSDKTEAPEGLSARGAGGAERGGDRAAERGTEAPRRPPARKTREQAIRGIPVSPGIAIGSVYDTTEVPAEAPRRNIPPGQVEAERQRLADAVALSRKQLGKLKTRLG